MHRHILKIGPVHFHAHVVERLDVITITLSANHTVHGYDPESREMIDRWICSLCARPPGETRCIHVFDSQHIMTT